MNSLSCKLNHLRTVWLVVSILFSCFSTNAQNPQLEWAKSFGWNANYDDYINQSIQTLDGNIATIGNAVLNDGVETIRISKISPDGHVIWETLIQEPTNYTDFRGVSMVQMPDSTFFVLGRIPSSIQKIYVNRPNEYISYDIPFRVYKGLSDILLLKLDAKGKLLWFKVYGGTVQDDPKKLLLTTDNKLLIAASTYSNDGDMAASDKKGNVDFWAAKLNTDGTIIWKKCLGGNQSDDLSDVIETSNNDFLLVGKSNSFDQYVTQNKGGNDVFVVRVNNNGTELWNRTFGGSQAEDAKSVVEMPDGSIMVGATSLSNDGDIQNQIHNVYFEDIWLLKLNAQGSLVWDKTYGGALREKMGYLALSKQKNLIIAGCTGSTDGDVSTGFHTPEIPTADYLDFWLFEIGSTGNIIWQKILGGNNNEEPLNAVVLKDGSLLASGKTRTNNNGDVSGFEGGSGYDAWITKIDFSCITDYQSNETYPSGETLIEVSNTITFNGSLSVGSAVTHQAGKSITFTPGTVINAVPSAKYIAKIEDCEGSLQPQPTNSIQTQIFQECRDGGVKLRYEPFTIDSTIKVFTLGVENQEARVPYDLTQNELIIKNSGSSSAYLGKFKLNISHESYKNLEIDVYAATCQHDNNPTSCPENTRKLILDKQKYAIGDTITVTWDGTLQSCQSLFWFPTNVEFISQTGKTFKGKINAFPASVQAQPSNNFSNCNVCHGWTKVELR